MTHASLQTTNLFSSFTKQTVHYYNIQPSFLSTGQTLPVRRLQERKSHHPQAKVADENPNPIILMFLNHTQIVKLKQNSTNSGNKTFSCHRSQRPNSFKDKALFAFVTMCCYESDGPWEINPKFFIYLSKMLKTQESVKPFSPNFKKSSWTFCDRPQHQRNQKNQDVIWAQVSGRDMSSQFISRLVTRRKKKATSLQRHG